MEITRIHFIFPFGLLLLLSAHGNFARIIQVGAKENVKTIRQAVTLAESGDTIIVNSGIYREGNIILQKSINLRGINFPILDGENKYEIITIHADNIHIEGFKFINTGVASINDLAAIKVLDSKGLRIRGNKFENTFFGIYFANSSQSWIEDNQLKSDAEAKHQIGNGIHLWKCEHMTIRNNHVEGHRDGIYFEFVTNSLVTGNVSERNMRYGLHFMFSHNDEYHDNKFINNGAGVAVMYTKNVTMTGNTFEQNWGPSAYGLLLKDIRDSRVEHNRFVKNTVGIYMEGSSRIHFEANSFSGNGWAIKLMASCDDNEFKANNFLHNTFDIATNGSLVLNLFTKNYWDGYQGYDLNKDGVGDVPFRPVSMYAMVVEHVPAAMILWRSFLVFLMDRSEKVMPAIIPENLKDDLPVMKAYDYARTSL